EREIGNSALEIIADIRPDGAGPDDDDPLRQTACWFVQQWIRAGHHDDLRSTRKVARSTVTPYADSALATLTLPSRRSRSIAAGSRSPGSPSPPAPGRRKLTRSPACKVSRPFDFNLRSSRVPGFNKNSPVVPSCPPNRPRGAILWRSA